MVKKKKESFFRKRFEVKKFIKPVPTLTPTQRRELVRGIATKTEIKPVAVVPIEETFEEPIRKRTPIEIKSNLLEQENGSILTRNKNIFFKE